MTNYGLVFEPKRGHVRPFTEYREIRRGRNRGRIEIKIKVGRASKVIVDPDAIRRFPEPSEGD